MKYELQETEDLYEAMKELLTNLSIKKSYYMFVKHSNAVFTAMTFSTTLCPIFLV